jgi:hypothetical protein
MADGQLWYAALYFEGLKDRWSTNTWLVGITANQLYESIGQG